jgi:rubrerythrin
MNTKIRIGSGPPEPRGPCRAIGDPDAAQALRLPVTRAPGARVALWMIMAALVAGPGPVRADEGASLAALEIAYGRELNAHAHRLAYAAAAERQGHCEAACLFRASATAESVRAARMAAAIEQLGARPAWTLASVVVRGTADNLEACREREVDERDRIYPRLASYAREECLYEAAAVFQYAKDAVATEVPMFEAALERVKSDETPPAIAMASPQSIDLAALEGCAATYYLCPGDGSLFASPIAKGCSNCGTRGSRTLVLTCISGGRPGTTGERAGQVAAR